MKNYFQNYMEAILNPLPELKRTFDAEKDYFIKALQNTEECANVLDIGCGIGRPLYHLAGKFPSVQFFGIEDDSKMLAEALKRTSEFMNINIKYADALNTKFPDDYFSFTYSTFNLIGSLKLDERISLLKEKKRITKPGSLIRTITWNKEDYTTEFLQKYYPTIGITIYDIGNNRTVTNKGTFYRFGGEELKETYNKAGLTNNQLVEIGNLWLAIEGEKI
ncbi:MAG: class I SAM-dependent methyltransferase [Nanoarchaeota archaeon]|nr:class I SAM-dependent methyltransferase [Nanoarchaeota archaeon]